MVTTVSTNYHYNKILKFKRLTYVHSLINCFQYYGQHVSQLKWGKKELVRMFYLIPKKVFFLRSQSSESGLLKHLYSLRKSLVLSALKTSLNSSI